MEKSSGPLMTRDQILAYLKDVADMYRLDPQDLDCDIREAQATVLEACINDIEFGWDNTDLDGLDGDEVLKKAFSIPGLVTLTDQPSPDDKEFNNE